MRFLIPLCMCLGVAVAQQGLPQYYQGAYNVPRAPIPSPGAWNGGAATGISYGTPQASATLASARPQWQSPATAARAVQYGGSPVSYAAPSPSYGAAPAVRSWSPAPAAPAAQSWSPAAPAAAPVSSIPSSYGWNVQHSSPAPAPAPQPQAAVIPTQYAQPSAAPQAYRPATTYASPAPVPQIPSPVQYPSAQYAAPQPQYASAARTWSPAPAAAAPAVRSWSPAPAAPAAPATYQAPASPISNALARPASVHYASIGENLNGDYKFGYQTDNGFREETRQPDGTVMGQYGFTDAEGKQRVVKYSAGVNGYQVLNDGSAPAAAPRPAAAAQPAIPNWAQQSAGQWSAQPTASAPQQQWG